MCITGTIKPRTHVEAANRAQILKTLMPIEEFNDLPDVRDGLTRKERIILNCIDKIQNARGGRTVPTAMLYGRVVEYQDISIDEVQLILQHLIGNEKIYQPL